MIIKWQLEAWPLKCTEFSPGSAHSLAAPLPPLENGPHSSIPLWFIGQNKCDHVLLQLTERHTESAPKYEQRSCLQEHPAALWPQLTYNHQCWETLALLVRGQKQLFTHTLHSHPAGQLCLLQLSSLLCDKLAPSQPSASCGLTSPLQNLPSSPAESSLAQLLLSPSSSRPLQQELTLASWSPLSKQKQAPRAIP